MRPAKEEPPLRVVVRCSNDPNWRERYLEAMQRALDEQEPAEGEEENES